MASNRCFRQSRAALVGTLLLAATTSGLAAQIHPQPVAANAARDRDYRALLTSANTLFDQLAAERGLTPERLTARLAPVRQSLAAWAARYHAKLTIRRIPAARLAGNRPIASTKYVSVDIPHGGTATCPVEWGKSGIPCTITAAEAIDNTLVCVYDCPDDTRP